MAAKSKQQSGQEEQEPNLGQQEARREKNEEFKLSRMGKTSNNSEEEEQLTLVARCEAGSGHASVTKNGLTRWSHHRTLSQSRRTPASSPESGPALETAARC